jgi:hypothetical protein
MYACKDSSRLHRNSFGRNPFGRTLNLLIQRQCQVLLYVKYTAGFGFYIGTEGRVENAFPIN